MQRLAHWHRNEIMRNKSVASAEKMFFHNDYIFWICLNALVCTKANHK